MSRLRPSIHTPIRLLSLVCFALLVAAGGCNAGDYYGMDPDDPNYGIRHDSGDRYIRRDGTVWP